MAENRSKSDQYLLRLPPGLREMLKDSAESHARSLNAEIIARVEEHPKLSRLRMDVAYLESENKRLAAELEAADKMMSEVRARAPDLERLTREIEEQVRRYEEKIADLSELNDELRRRTSDAQKSATRSQEIIRRLVNLLVRTLGVEEKEIEAIKSAPQEEE